MRGCRLFVLIAVIAILLSCSADKEPDFSGITLDLTTAVSPSTASIYSVSADFAGMCHAGYSNNLDREYPMLDEMGVTWLHRDFSWWSIQPEEKKDSDPSDWNWSNFDSFVDRGRSENKKIMGMLLYGVGWVHTILGGCGGGENAGSERIICNDTEIAAFTKYAVETVRRYNGKKGHNKVDAWLIWNEPDLQPRFWTGTKDQYFALAKATAEAIRELDKEEKTTTVLLGGVFTAMVSDDWITGLAEKGGMDKLDGIAFHPYSPNPKGCLSIFNSFKQRVGVYGFADKIWVNEMGYPTYLEQGPIPTGRYGTDRYEGDMPEVAVQTFTLLAAAGARNLTWYHLFDGATRKESDSEAWFGLVWRKSDDEWIEKGGYWGYALCANNIPGKTYKKLNFQSSVPQDLECYYFEGGGKRVLVVWNENPLVTRNVRIILGGSNHKLWNAETGESSSLDSTSVHTLYPIDNYQKTLVFLTWDE
jgi:hypothetical protein